MHPSRDGEPTVTVVIPTYTRREFLPELVASLKAQTADDFRAVFVDDGSSDDTVAVLDGEFNGDPRFIVTSTENRGPAAARNVACLDATTEWLAFTDDDCLPQPGWLESFLRAAERERADVVQGATIKDPAVRRADLPWFARSRDIRSWSNRFQMCNMFLRTSHVHAVGGFDESFPPHGFGEDSDLGLRVVRHGGQPAFASEALVHHRLLPLTYLEWLGRRWRWAQIVHAVRVNPGVRVNFPHRYVAQRSHVAFWLALPLTGLAVARGRWEVPVLGLAGWVGQRLYYTRHEDRSVRARLLRSGLELVGTAVESVAFAVQCARERTFLL